MVNTFTDRERRNNLNCGKVHIPKKPQPTPWGRRTKESGGSSPKPSQRQEENEGEINFEEGMRRLEGSIFKDSTRVGS